MPSSLILGLLDMDLQTERVMFQQWYAIIYSFLFTLLHHTCYLRYVI